MSGDTVISVTGLGKKYLIGHEVQRQPYTALRDVAADAARKVWNGVVNAAHGRTVAAGGTTEEFWALKDVNFDVKRGEVVGIIGRNGAGKSTLLKILSRITEPTTGRVEITGRVASLLEVGTGFHPELTGRENIYLNGAILGMSRAEIRRKFDEIVAFAGVEKFLDTPVKRYSSGMYMRLAFSIAAHLDPEILIVDEVLAVGDAEFQKKSLGKMSEVVGRGRTVIFVSHNLTAIRTLCPRSIYLKSGSVAADRDSETAAATYLSDNKLLAEDSVQSNRKIDDAIYLRDVRILPKEIRTGDRVIFEFNFEARQSVCLREWVLCLFSPAGVLVGIVDARANITFPLLFSQKEFTFVVEIKAIELIERNYRLSLYLVSDGFSGTVWDVAEVTVHASDLQTTYSPDARGLVSFNGHASLIS